MTKRDILISRVLNPDGTPMAASPNRRQDSVEELWEVAAEGEEPATGHPLEFVLETARMWQERRGGDIYRKDVNDSVPILLERKLL